MHHLGLARVSKARATLHFPGNNDRIIISEVGRDLQDHQIPPLAKCHRPPLARVWVGMPRGRDTPSPQCWLGAAHDPGTAVSKHFPFFSELFIWKPPSQLRLSEGANYTVLISKVGITVLSLLQLGDFTKFLIPHSAENRAFSMFPKMCLKISHNSAFAGIVIS